MEYRSQFNSTPESDLSAVNENGFNLQYVEIQNEFICEAAILQNPRAIKYVKKQTTALCLLAVKACGDVLQYISNPT